MQIEVRFEPYKPQALIVHLKGSLDTMTDQDFRHQILDQIARGIRHILIHMGGVKYLSSIGLGLIIDLKKRVESYGGTLFVFEPQLAVKRVLEIVKLESWELTLENADAQNPFLDYVRQAAQKKSS